MRRVAAMLATAALGLGLLPLAALAATPYAATYAATVPASIAVGGSLAIPVTLVNTGTATWNATGANLVDLTYHWYDPAGNVVVWDGVRTALGADVLPNAQRVVTATVAAPPGATGPYLLRFALVKEGVAWFDPEPAAHAVASINPFTASWGQIGAQHAVADSRFSVTVPVTNAGSVLWPASGANPVDLSYHWIDASGKAVVWDGERTKLGSDLVAGAARSLTATVTAPSAAGTYSLQFDMVREGVAWFGTPASVPAVIDPATYRAAYSVPAGASAFTGENRTIPLTITNTGNVSWAAGGANPVHVSYHWYDANGGLVWWDGQRTSFASDVAPGQSQNVQLAFTTPGLPGNYQLQIDLVREGVAWFSAIGSPPATLGYQVALGYNVAYGATAAVSSITLGAQFPVSVTITNNGQRVWPATGSNPITVSYHWYDSSGNPVLFNGLRGVLPADVAPGTTVTVSFTAMAPSSSGSYQIGFDLVQEGIAWFSQAGIATSSRQGVSVFPGVTLYGKGWGHGVGLSQWGAQGWASGAFGQALTGEQIVQKYFPSAQITQAPPTLTFRVLLSSPSTGCVGRTVYSLAQMRSDGGVLVKNDAANKAVILAAQPSQTVRVWVDGMTLNVMDEWSGQTIWSGGTAITISPANTSQPITLLQKLRFYRGDLRFEVAGWGVLRVVNWVNDDDYVRGSVPSEMLGGWQVEAYKAQAYAARTYGAWKAATMAAVPWDLRDDTSDQCYGGASVETDPTNLAAFATASRILTYNGGPIRAYYASSDGGATDDAACVWGLVKVNGRYTCGSPYAYLQSVPDPADLLAVGPQGPNPHRSWTVSLAPWQIENAVLRAGYDIGSYVSIDLSNRAPGGHVISVIVRGTGGTVELTGEGFLRSKLGLKSTEVRTSPW